jgi:hypothetical protein
MDPSYVLPTVTTVDNPQGWGYGARLDELLVRLAAAPQRELLVETARDQAQRVQTEANAEDFVPEFGNVFSRSDFSGGEGLDFAHVPNLDEFARTRFWDSKGISVFSSEPGTLDAVEGLTGLEAIASTGTDSAPYMLIHPDGYLLVIDGQNVKKVSTPLGTPSVTSEDPFVSYAVDIEHICLVGDEVFATGAGASALLSKRSAAGSWSELGGALDISSKLWYAKGRLMGAVDEVLHVINETTGATLATMHTLPTGETWEAVIDAGPIILAAGGGQLFMFEDQSGTLTLVNQVSITATDLPVSLAAGLGTVLIGTEETAVGGGLRGRLYRATVGPADTSFALGAIQLLRTWEPPTASSSGAPMAFAVARDSAYMIVHENATDTYVWRYYFPTAGISRDRLLESTTGAQGFGFGFLQDIAFASVGGQGVVRDSGELEGAAYIILPAADFFTSTTKSWLGCTTTVEGFDGGGLVRTYYSTEVEALLDPNHASWTLIQTIQDDSASGIEIPFTNVQSRWMILKVEIAPVAQGSTGPRLRSVAVRGYTDSEEVLITLPVSTSDRVERYGRRTINVPGWGNQIFEELLSREARPVVLEVYNPPITVRGTIEAIRSITNAQPERGSAPEYVLLLIRGRILEEIVGATPGGSGGIGLLGVDLLGVEV